jgi:hypothetical protein
MISNIKFKSFQINLMMELFMYLILELLKVFLNFYSIGIKFFQKEKNVIYIFTSLQRNKNMSWFFFKVM